MARKASIRATPGSAQLILSREFDHVSDTIPDPTRIRISPSQAALQTRRTKSLWHRANLPASVDSPTRREGSTSILLVLYYDDRGQKSLVNQGGTMPVDRVL